jgi:glutamate/aspartate transport system ATP-binding protein
VAVHDPKTNLPKLRSRVGMVFQHFELFPHLSVTENLTIAQVKVLGRNPADAKTRGLKMLDRVGLTAHKDKFPGQLSGGQQQRVAIARALSMDPKVASRVIFMDVGGKILEDCSKDEFFGNPEARQPRTKEFLNKILQH